MVELEQRIEDLFRNRNRQSSEPSGRSGPPGGMDEAHTCRTVRGGAGESTAESCELRGRQLDV